jgi:gas vesicle protein
MKMNKNLLLAGVVTTVAAGSLLSLGIASADSNSGDSLIDKIATKFSLNRDEVEAVFEENRAEKQAERAADFSENLQEKVDSGDITAEQKTLIETKFAELQTARETEREALEQWAEDNGIDMKFVLGGRGHMDNSDRLDDAVADGDITAEQKTLIEQKQDELQTARETARDELEQWAEDNGIELKDVLGGMGGHGRGGMGGPGMMR